MKKLWLLLIILFTFTFVIAKEWTIMIYIAADNNLSSAVNSDIDEMEAALSDTSDINFLVQVDGLGGAAGGYDDIDKTKITEVRRYCLGAGGDAVSGKIDVSAAMAMGELNTADPNELINFVTWGVNVYPADNYGLILWNHGQGWIKGPNNTIMAEVYDPITRTGTGEFITINSANKGGLSDDTSNDAMCTADTDNEWKYAMDGILMNVGKKLRFLGHDMCIMSYMEVIWDEAEVTEMIIASEANIAWNGWPYSLWITNLIANPLATNDQIGTWMVNDYANTYSGTNATLSYMNMEGFTKQLGMNHLRDDIWSLSYALLNVEGGRDNASVNNCITNAMSMSSGVLWEDFRDLWGFCDNLMNHAGITPGTKNLASSVKTDIDNLVDLAWADGIYNGSHGLGIYLPSSAVYWFPGGDDNGTDTMAYEWSPWGGGYTYNGYYSGCEQWTLFIYGLTATNILEANVMFNIGEDFVDINIDGTYDDYEILRDGEKIAVISSMYKDTGLNSGQEYHYTVNARKGLDIIKIGDYKVRTNIIVPNAYIKNSVMYLRNTGNVSVYNINGQVVKQYNGNNANAIINMADMPIGYYIIKGKEFSKRLMLLK